MSNTLDSARLGAGSSTIDAVPGGGNPFASNAQPGKRQKHKKGRRGHSKRIRRARGR